MKKIFLTVSFFLLLTTCSEDDVGKILFQLSLFQSVIKGDIFDMEIYMHKGAKIDMPISERHLNMAKLLISKSGGNEELLKFFLFTEVGMTPLDIACQQGNLEIVKYIITKSKNKKHMTKEGKSPLYFAAENGKTGVLGYLLRHKINLETTDSSGETAIFTAAKNGQLFCVQMLIKSGANINHANRANATPVLAAATRDHWTTVHYLLDNGADPDVKCDSGTSLLLVACAAGREDIVEKCIAKSIANINNPCLRDGITPLMAASGMGNTFIIKMLLEKGADINASNYNGRTALIISAMNNHTHATIMLIENGADTNVKDKMGRTAFSVAVERKNDSLLTYLRGGGVLK